VRFEPHPRQSTLAFAAALAMLALVAPATSARPVEDFIGPQPAETPCEPSRDLHAGNPSACEEQLPAARGTEAPMAEVSAATTARDVPSDAGFDWGAAAIGAGTAIALLLLGSMAAIALIGRGRVRVAR
jgi:hypothetical protein